MLRMLEVCEAVGVRAVPPEFWRLPGATFVCIPVAADERENVQPDQCEDEDEFPCGSHTRDHEWQVRSGEHDSTPEQYRCNRPPNPAE